MTEQRTQPVVADPGGHDHQPARDYLPGMGRRWLLPLYDPLTRLLGVRGMHQRLVDQADLRAGLRVLEIGCGTGNLAILAKRQHPGSTVVGLDPDPTALARAGRKARRAGLAIELDRGFADRLPYPDGSVDRVFSALMLHHVDPADRPAVLREVRRVLTPGGSVHVVDFGGGGGRHPGGGLILRLAHRHPHGGGATGGGTTGGDTDVPGLMLAAGLTDARQTGHGSSPFGQYTFYRATR
jgi:SAM-dependent methyltransferase